MAELETEENCSDDYFHPTTYGDAVRTVISRTFQFNGRARRAEYWYWMLFGAIVLTGLSIIEAVLLGTEIFGYAFMAIMSLMTVSVMTRRLHDTGWSGWWQFLFWLPFVGWIICIAWMAQPSEENMNEYGPAY
ncbi:MAG: DUF805 domain-containing protein [Pseudomonadota bacterium]